MPDMTLSPEQWEQLSAGIFQVIHRMNLDTSYQSEGVIDIEPILWPILQPIIQQQHDALAARLAACEQEVERLMHETDC